MTAASRVFVSSDVSLGCDPEFFFEKEGEGVIGAEKVIGDKLESGSGANFVLDGVQIELNPPPFHCRESGANLIAHAFRKLREHLATRQNIKATFTTCINLSKGELDSLSEKAKLLGCAPSLNRADAKAAVTVNGATSLSRSAGGHIHMGISHSKLAAPGNRERLVDLLDVLLGNTCVLIDRDPNAAERRKIYGRAGEYRLPAHGLEYRTLSNFWLRAYPLFSFVMGTARNAASILHTSITAPYYADLAKSRPGDGHIYAAYNWDPEAELLEAIGGEAGLKMAREAINTSDVALADEVWQKVRGWMKTLPDSCSLHTGLTRNTLKNFDDFAKVVREKGFEAYFPQNPLDHWADLQVGHNGWEAFITRPRPVGAYGRLS